MAIEHIYFFYFSMKTCRYSLEVPHRVPATYVVGEVRKISAPFG